ncbi:MAG: outer membrane protein assembly factor BamA [Microbacter sp.]
MLKRTIFTLITLLIAIITFGQNEDTASLGKADTSKIITTPVIKYTPNPKEYEIAGINVTGSTTYENYVIIGFSGLTVGEKIKVPGDEITDAVKRFWKQGLFSDVKILASKIEGDKIWLTIDLKQLPRISQVNYNGIPKSYIDDVSPKIGIEKGGQMTPNLRDKAVEILKKYLLDKGFRYATVNVVEKDDPDQKGMTIVNINVDKGPVVKVNKIFLSGNKALTYHQVVGAMKKTNEPTLLNLFKTKKFVDANFQADKKLIVKRYNDKGFRDAAVVWDSIANVGNNKVNVYLKVHEGQRYYIRSITWVGNTVYPSQYLSLVLGIKPGDVYNAKLLDDRLNTDDDAIAKLYKNKGYLFMSVDPIEANTSNDSIDFEMHIYEGKPATINNVTISGNTHVYENVIRREMFVRPGQLYNESDITRTMRQLAQMGNFEQEKLIPDIQPNPDDGTVDIGWPLVSKSNDQIEFSAGWGQTGVVGSLSLKFSNFAIQNLFKPSTYRFVPEGEGQTFSISAQTNGSYYQAYSINFVEPWLGGKRPNSLSVSAYYSIQTGVSNNYASYMNNYYNSYYASSMYGNNPYSSSALSYQADPTKYIHTLGLSASWGKRLKWPDDYFQLNLGLEFQHYALSNWDYFLMKNGTSNLASVNVVLSRNSIDNPIFTRTGSTFSLSGQFTPPYSLFSPHKDYSNMTDAQAYKWVEFYKIKFASKMFVPLSASEHPFVLMARAEYGFLGYYNKNLQSPFETFYMGGDGMTGYTTYGTETIGLRGYENGSLTPISTYRGQTGQMGYVYSRIGAEIHYPLLLQQTTNIYALAFFDAGNCWSSFNQFNPFDLKRSAGFGVRIFLPMFGLLGIDWGYGFDPINGSKQYSGSHFHFVIGQEF